MGYEITGVPNGTYKLTADAFGYQSLTTGVTVSNADTELNVTLTHVTSGQRMGTVSVGTTPQHMVVDAQGYLWVLNTTDNTVTKVHPIDGSVIGTYQTGMSPWGILADPTDGIWVSHTLNSTYGDGAFRMLAGLGEISSPVFDSNGVMYFCDNTTNRIRTINTSGMIDTFVSGGLVTPNSLTFDANGNLYIADGSGVGRVVKVTPSGAASYYTTGLTAVVTDLAWQPLNERLYIVDSSDIKSVTTGGVVSVLSTPNMSAYVNNLTLDSQGNLYATCSDHNIYKITSGGVTTLITGGGAGGYVDGTLVEGRFSNPKGITTSGDNILYVLDYSNSRIRKIDLTGDQVSTVAGGKTWVNNYMSIAGGDGIGVQAGVQNPIGKLTLHNNKLYFVGNPPEIRSEIRYCDLQTNLVRTFATGYPSIIHINSSGSTVEGYRIGSTELLNGVSYVSNYGLSFDSTGNLMVLQYGPYNNGFGAVPQAQIVKYSTTSGVLAIYPYVDKYLTGYFAFNYANNHMFLTTQYQNVAYVVRITPENVISTSTTVGSYINGGVGSMSIDTSGNVWVPNYVDSLLFKVNADSWVVTNSSTSGTAPRDIISDTSGYMWISNKTANEIVRINPVDATVVEQFATGINDQPTYLAITNDNSIWYTLGSQTNKIGALYNLTNRPLP